MEEDHYNSDDLEDVFVTNLDSELSVQEKEEKKAFMSKSTAAEVVNAEWRRLQKEAGHSVPEGPEGIAANAGSTSGNKGAVIAIQPGTLSEADVFLQPSQVEEMLGQNSLLLHTTADQCKPTPQVAAKPPKVTIRSVSSSSTNSLQPNEDLPTASRRPSLWAGFISCLSPMMGALKKEKRSSNLDEWEIPFADIRELDFIGSGSQGAVFVGDYLREKVAVKKVKDVTYCQEAKHLRKLSHPNIVKFK